MLLSDGGWVSLYMQLSNLRKDKGKILRHIRNLSKLFDTLNLKKPSRYILEPKKCWENELQNANHNFSNNHQHVTNEKFQVLVRSQDNGHG